MQIKKKVKLAHNTGEFGTVFLFCFFLFFGKSEFGTVKAHFWVGLKVGILNKNLEWLKERKIGGFSTNS